MACGKYQFNFLSFKHLLMLLLRIHILLLFSVSPGVKWGKRYWSPLESVLIPGTGEFRRVHYHHPVNATAVVIPWFALLK